VGKWKNHDRITAIFAPHAPYTVDDETFLHMKEISEKHDIKIHLHLHETKKEVDDHVTENKMRPIERIKKLGLLNKNLLAVHMTQLNEEEIKVVAESGAHVVHCPESNLKLGSGLCPVNVLLNAGTNVCLGTDGPASNDDLDLLGEMRTSALLDKYSHNGVGRTLSVWDMLAMATLNGAKALGVADKIGTLEVGKEADLIAIRLSTHPVYDPMRTLVYAGTNRVEYVYVAGQCLIYNNKLLTINEAEVKSEAEEWRTKLIEWDTKRKKVDLDHVRKVVDMANSENNDVQTKEKLKNDLIELRDNIFHWIYFVDVRKYSNVGATKQQLEEIQYQVSEALKRVE